MPHTPKPPDPIAALAQQLRADRAAPADAQPLLTITIGRDGVMTLVVGAAALGGAKA